MKKLLSCGSLCLVASAALLVQAGQHASQAAPKEHLPPADVYYTLSLLNLNPPSVRVEVKCRGAESGHTTFAVAEQWGGYASSGKDFLDVSVKGDDGHNIAFEHPKDYEWSVLHALNARLTFSYTLQMSEDRAPAERANDYRPIITKDLMHIIGNHGLAYPKHLADDNPRTIQLEWKGFTERGWKVASSYGPGTEKRSVSMTLDEFRNALFLGGNIRLSEKEIRGTKIGVAVHGSWHFTDEQFADLVTRIIESERTFFDDWSDPWYLVSLIPSGPNDPHSLSIGGTGLTNCFAMFVSPGATLDPASMNEQRMKRILAHEYFHRWNGGRLDFAEPEGQLYWFSEGFTDFYARRLLLRAGFSAPAEYISDLNDSVTEYFTSELRNEPNSRILADFWKDTHVQTLPYRRGDMIALTLDQQIREASGGKKSLDDFMRDLLGKPEPRRTKIDLDQLIQRIGVWTSSDFAESVRRSVENGADIKLPARLAEPPLELGQKEVPTFELGFDDQASVAAKKAVGVKVDSAAYKAGLRDGQLLAGWSMEPGNVNREVQLTIREGDSKREIRYLPEGKRVKVPYFKGKESSAGQSR